MKAAAFNYCKVKSLSELFSLLAQHGEQAKILAGGQTLLATLNMRLSEPEWLIDITGLSELGKIKLEGDQLLIGALVTHTQIEQSAEVARHAPLLAAAAPHIAHRAIRNVGTWGGSLALGDPAAEWPACLLALDGSLILQSAAGQRQVAAKDFFKDLYTVDLHPDEILVAAKVPAISVPASASSKLHWQAFDELARRRGDYAVAGLALSLQFVGATISQARLAFLGMGSTPLRAMQAESLLQGQALSQNLIEQVATQVRTELKPLADLTHSAATKKHLAGVLSKRLLKAALGGQQALAA